MEGTSGRRLALARWLTAPDTPASALLARVAVNRLWQHVFGRGLVPTSDNFGLQGQPPTHPELLEWLAAEFVADGWRVKPSIKRLVMSTAYRQASRDRGPQDDESADPMQVDPENDLLWRMRLRRLESEVIRDAMLAASGLLSPAMGGPSIMIRSQPDGMVTVARDKLAAPSDAFRRSVYLVSRRAYNASLLTVFDQPLVATNCARRDASAVPLQSLVMLNDAEVAEAAGAFAGASSGWRHPPTERRSTPRFAWRWPVNPTPPNEPPARSFSTASARCGAPAARTPKPPTTWRSPSCAWPC